MLRSAIDHRALAMPGKADVALQIQTPAEQLLQMGDPVASGSGKTVLLMAPSGQTFVWAPYTGVGDFTWAPYLRSLWLEGLQSFLLCMVVSTTVSISTSASGAQNALGIALAYALSIIFFYSWRQTMRLPRHLNPALTLAELIHGHVGLVVAIPYMAMQIGGSALAYVPLNQLGNSAIPNYTTALRPVTYWGAVAVDAGFGMMVIYTYLQNTSVMDHLSGVAPRNAEASHKFRGFSNLALLSGLAVFVGVLLSYPSGTYTLSNMVPYFGPAIAIGFTVPDLYSWTIPCLWSFAAAAAAYALHLLTWNVNGLATSDFEKFVASVAKDEEADDVETQQWIASHMKTA